MRCKVLVILAVCSLGSAIEMDDAALFFRSELDDADLEAESDESPDVRLSRQAAVPMDPKIRSILEFIQDQYADMRKKKSANTDPKFLLLSSAVQPSLHYIPVQATPTKARPPTFSPADNSPSSVEINQELSGYSRDNPQPNFPIVSPHSGFSSPKPSPTPPGYSSGSQGYSSSSPGYSSSSQGYSSSSQGFSSGSSQGYSSIAPIYSSSSKGKTSSSKSQSGDSHGHSSSFQGHSIGSSSGIFDSQEQDFNSVTGPSFSSPKPDIYSSPSPSRPLYQSPSPTPSRPLYQSPSPTPSRPVYQSPSPTSSRPVYQSPSPRPSVTNNGDGFSSPRPFDPAPSGSDGSNSVHPPHIHEIGVECAKDKMTINIEFDRVFDGEIYAKGYYKECRFVNANSGQKKYSFTVSLNSCGTQFVERFKEGGQAYLENVLVLQNEPGIQEVWDTIRSVRCLWEGSIKKALTSALSVDMLSQETVTFSGDTAVARLDIQMGRGPLAPIANGLVKIGEIMTLVVSVEGDPDFDIHVRDCVARDESSDNVVQLTDDQGCILKPKLMGAFQKTRDTGNSGASVMAYAYFQAFKFPEIMDLTLDCNVELCKTDCEMCPDPNQSLEPGRRRRSADNNNSTLGDPARISRTFRIVAAEDFAFATPTSEVAPLAEVSRSGVCMSMPGFMLASLLLISMLIGSCSLSGYWWLKSQRTGKGLA